MAPLDFGEILPHISFWCIGLFMTKFSILEDCAKNEDESKNDYDVKNEDNQKLRRHQRKRFLEKTNAKNI